ncbi:MAG: branched-chain amino acid ABC transporter permease [Betaproteobacteria bacterium]|nr:branched-chain amino acid ABC transporter permease [Betaproteobacteria bacterium]
MLYLQVLLNGLVLGGLFACIAAGFSLVWGVLNVINILHGSFIVLGAYAAWYAYGILGIHPFLSIILVAPLFFALGYAIQSLLLNRVIAAPVLLTLTLTFGLDLMLSNAMLAAFKADFRKLVLDPPLGLLSVGNIVLPVDRLAAMALALLLTLLLYLVLSRSRTGRAIVAVRMDREAASLMGVNVSRTYAITFGIGALMAGVAGPLIAMIFPISPLTGPVYLGKAFVVCVLGGLGSVPGAMVGGLVLGVVESFAALWFGPEHAITVSFALLIAMLVFRPTGLIGRKGYE